MALQPKSNNVPEVQPEGAAAMMANPMLIPGSENAVEQHRPAM